MKRGRNELEKMNDFVFLKNGNWIHSLILKSVYVALNCELLSLAFTFFFYKNVKIYFADITWQVGFYQADFD